MRELKLHKMMTKGWGREKKFKKTKNEEKIYCNLDRKNAGLEKLGQNKSIISIEKIVFCASHYCLCFCCRFFVVVVVCMS